MVLMAFMIVLAAILAEPSLRALKWKGHYLVVGFAAGDIPKNPLNLIMLKGIHVSGVFWGRFIEEQPEDFKDHMKLLLEWCRQGKLNPHIEAVYPIEQTIDGIKYFGTEKSHRQNLNRCESLKVFH